jgi:hypothetical protein
MDLMRPLYSNRQMSRDNLKNANDPAVISEKHGVFLIDRRKIVPGTRLYREDSDYVLKGKSRYYWMVLDYSDSHWFGEWRGFKVLKEAEKYWEHLHRLRSHALVP